MQDGTAFLGSRNPLSMDKVKGLKNTVLPWRMGCCSAKVTQRKQVHTTATANKPNKISRVSVVSLWNSLPQTTRPTSELV